ncbi:MAG: hydroxymyristoyl-ACP dehydratase [Bacteroidota bacterium]
MSTDQIINLLPYRSPFLFVDELAEVTDESAIGYYTYPEDAYFYEGHFKDYPVTPGVLLAETMAQIGLVCLGIHLLAQQLTNTDEAPAIALSSQAVDYFLPVYPGERVRVVSQKQYFRFKKLKCQVSMYNAKDELVCKGTMAGMLTTKLKT